MNKDDLQAMFCLKLYREITRFKDGQLELSKEDVFSNAFMIDNTIIIYEALVEASQKMEAGVMKGLLFVPDLLAYFYERWLQVEDSQYKELNEFLSRGVRELLVKQEAVA